MILVTGAAGTVGREVVKQLQQEGVPFRAGYHTDAKTQAAQAHGIDAVTIDYNHLNTLRSAFRGINRLYLLTPGDPSQEELELNALEAARVTGVRHIVKQSVWKAGEQAYSFARLHRALEQAIEASGLAWTFLRPNGFMQNLVTYEGPVIRSEGIFFSSTANAPMSHIDARDVARVAVRALVDPGHERKTYLLSGPSALSYAQMAEELSRALGRTIRHVGISATEQKSMLLSADLPEEYVDQLIDLDRYYREGHAREVTGDVKQVTGSEPIGFAQFAQDHALLLQPAPTEAHVGI